MEETIPEAKTNYAKSPADIRERAEAIARDWRFDEAALAGAICSALVMERERCAKVADGMFDLLYGEPGLQASHERNVLDRVAKSIRKGPAATSIRSGV